MSGAEMIAAERQRQIDVEGWTVEHDDEQVSGDLARAAACYAEVSLAPAPFLRQGFPPASWPWSFEWWKPTDDRVRNLVKAGALIAAEIDRIERTTAARPVTEETE